MCHLKFYGTIIIILSNLFVIIIHNIFNIYKPKPLTHSLIVTSQNLKKTYTLEIRGSVDANWWWCKIRKKFIRFHNIANRVNWISNYFSVLMKVHKTRIYKISSQLFFKYYTIRRWRCFMYNILNSNWTTSLHTRVYSVK